MLDAQLLAQLIELMVAAGLALPAGKQAIRELLAVVSQQLGDPDRTGLVQRLQEGLRTGGCLVGLELHEDPARGPVDGHEQIAPAVLVLHLGQVLHIHVHIAWLVALEGLVDHSRLLGLEGIEVASPMSAQASVQVVAVGPAAVTGDVAVAVVRHRGARCRRVLVQPVGRVALGAVGHVTCHWPLVQVVAPAVRGDLARLVARVAVQVVAPAVRGNLARLVSGVAVGLVLRRAGQVVRQAR